jgi:outer membrane protein assembly factor BamB
MLPTPGFLKLHGMSWLRLLRFEFLTACTLAATSASLADDWPQWLGPNRDSVWREAGMLDTFPPGGPTVRWRVPIGAGYSGPSVANGRVYAMDRQPSAGTNASNLERVLCFDESDGKLLWTHSYPCDYTVSYPAGPRVTPLVHGGKVVTLGAQGRLSCLDASSGALVWSQELTKDYGIKAPAWGFAGHPLLEGNKLICLVGGQGTTAVAFDFKNGKEVWRALSAREPGYSSPMIYELGGKRHLVIWHPEAVNDLDPETGQVHWSVPFESPLGLSVATPRQLGETLFVTAFYSGSMMLRLDAAGTAPSILWRTTKKSEMETTHLNAIICTPFLELGFLYGICSYGQLRCLRTDSGERIWETLKATTSGKPVRWANAFIVKNGNRFFLFNEAGDLIIARLSSAGFEEISRAHILDPTNKDCGRLVVWSHPAFANRCLYARNDKELLCVDLALK